MIGGVYPAGMYPGGGASEDFDGDGGGGTGESSCVSWQIVPLMAAGACSLFLLLVRMVSAHG